MVVKPPCTKIEIPATENQSTPIKIEIKRKSRCCGGMSKLEVLKVLGSFLVPLLIGVFTIASAVQQHLLSEANRLADMQIATQQRDQEQRQANELHQETVYAVYIQEMSEVSMKLKRENLNHDELDQEWRVVRAKSLSAIRQFDAKRKSYLIQFLYETQFLFRNRSPIDLSGSNLSGIRLTRPDSLSVTFDRIALTHVALSYTSFADLRLMQADFSGSILMNSNFANAFLLETNFTGCDLRNADLRGVLTDHMIIRDVNLSGAILETPFPTIANTILPNGSYVFYSDDKLKSDRFNASVNLIKNGDFVCENNTNSSEISGWIAWFKPVAIVVRYSSLPSFAENSSVDDCVLWGQTMNNPGISLQQIVYLDNYTRLIDSGNASYEFSFDAGGIDIDEDYVSLTADFRGHHSQLLISHQCRKYPS